MKLKYVEKDELKKAITVSTCDSLCNYSDAQELLIIKKSCWKEISEWTEVFLVYQPEETEGRVCI